MVQANKWANIYLQPALKRLSPQLKGYQLVISDLIAMQQLCAYEVTRFCLGEPGCDLYHSVDCCAGLLSVLRSVHGVRVGVLRVLEWWVIRLAFGIFFS